MPGPEVRMWWNSSWRVDVRVVFVCGIPWEDREGMS